ncbi:hypothetical protein CASFOL_017334 [Castilleja foliolosa]|uniref:Uncharacterized protein n=1 Tax=Castilleja foliolosa TaxID=1961234 RepID=A0ABD3DCL8_9LAMI
MGLILGKITVESPKYKVFTSTNEYEIRKYPPSIIAEVTYYPVQLNHGGGLYDPRQLHRRFRQTPENEAGENRDDGSSYHENGASEEEIAMTAPVVTKSGGGEEVMMMMGFILPSKYVKSKDAPRPVDERVVINEEVERKYGVVKFSGVALGEVVAEKVEKLVWSGESFYSCTREGREFHF